MSITLVSDPVELAPIFETDRETHLYGLPDLEEPFWSPSRWFLRGPAAVGRVSIGNQWVTGYAMSQRHPAETLALLSDVHEELPPGTWVTGPLGSQDALVPIRPCISKGVHQRMILIEPPAVPDRERPKRLRPGDMESLIELHSSDPGGSFFLPSLLSVGIFFGIWEEGLLVASAGTHVTSDRYGVAAVGSVITRPSHRGIGLGYLVVVALCRELSARYRTIGLNVAVTNNAAIRIYEQAGFRARFEYEEIQLL